MANTDKILYSRGPVTICIAAIADNKKSVIVAADKMLSLTNPVPYQFEPKDLSKIYKLDNCAVVMAAGNTIFCDEVSRLAVQKVSGSEDKSRQKVVELVLDAYHEVRRRMVVDSVLKPRQMTYEEYLDKQKTLHDSVVANIENAITENNIGIELIIAGYDQGEAYINIVQHPGISVSLDVVGYACIGIGAPHAQIHMIESNYEKSLSVKEITKMVKAAKKKSEYAPGVGQGTDIMVLPEEVKDVSKKS
jgi:20S proteasome alpha/beta subunit